MQAFIVVLDADTQSKAVMAGVEGSSIWARVAVIELFILYHYISRMKSSVPDQIICSTNSIYSTDSSTLWPFPISVYWSAGCKVILPRSVHSNMSQSYRYPRHESTALQQRDSKGKFTSFSFPACSSIEHRQIDRQIN